MNSRLNATAPPFIPAPKIPPWMKDTEVERNNTSTHEKAIRNVLNWVTKDTVESKANELVVLLLEIDISKNESLKMLVDLFLKSAITNFRSIFDQGNIPIIGDLCSRVYYKLGESESLICALMDYCLEMIETYKQNESIDMTEEKKFLAPIALLADVVSKIPLIQLQEKLKNELRNLTVRDKSVERHLVFCSLMIYEKIKILLEDERLEFENSFKSLEDMLIQNPRKNSFISAQINLVLNPKITKKVEEEGNETTDLQGLSDSESDKFSSTSSESAEITTTSILNEMLMEIKDIVKLQCLMNQFESYVKDLDKSVLMDRNFSRQTATYLLEVALAITTPYESVNSDRLKPLCKLCSEIHKEYIKKGVNGETMFRPIMINVCQSLYDRSYLPLYEYEKQEVIGVTQFIAGLYEVDFLYGNIIMAEIKALLNKDYINETRLECAVVLLRDSFDRLDKSVRVEIQGFYDQLSGYLRNSVWFSANLKKEIDQLIQRRVEKMESVKKEMESKSPSSTK